jgi:hypothetical protein
MLPSLSDSYTKLLKRSKVLEVLSFLTVSLLPVAMFHRRKLLSAFMLHLILKLASKVPCRDENIRVIYGMSTTSIKIVYAKARTEVRNVKTLTIL